MTTQYLFYILFGYLSGSVLYGYLLPKYIKKIDVTKESPDQNPGVANAFLCAGAPIGFCALMLELLKGYLPVHAAMHVLNPRHLIFGLVLAAPVLGHAFPFWNPKMGGKSIAVSFWSIARVSPLLETGFDFGGMLFDVFYCDCHSASLFPVCCHIRNFLGNGDNQEGTAWNHSGNRDFVLFSDLEASCKVSK